MIGVLAAVRAITDKYPRVQQLLENEPTPCGMFRAEIDDPTHANAFATSAWELTALRCRCRRCANECGLGFCILWTVIVNCV